MACDICGKTGEPLSSIREVYQTDDIKDMCSDCERVINKHLWVIKEHTLKLQGTLLKRFMDVLSNKEVEEKPIQRIDNKLFFWVMGFSLGFCVATILYHWR
jgi:hypothetical protein